MLSSIDRSRRFGTDHQLLQLNRAQIECHIWDSFCLIPSVPHVLWDTPKTPRLLNSITTMITSQASPILLLSDD